VLERKDVASGEARIKTRLKFSLRQPLATSSSPAPRFTLLRNDRGRLRVAAQIVDGFADLNDNAKRSFTTPDQGLNR
jgi:hypothetical protein